MQNLSEKIWLHRAEADEMYIHAAFLLFSRPVGLATFPKVKKKKNDQFTSFCYIQQHITTAKE